MKILSGLVLSVALILMLTLPVHAVIYPNLIINGDFETPDIQGGYQFFLEPIPGWGLTACDPNLFPGYTTLGVVIIDRVIGWEANSGEQYATLDTWYNSGIIQSINTMPGETYNIDFSYSPRIGVAPTSNVVALYINDVLTESVSGDGVGLINTSWSVHHNSFTATGTSSTIKFLAAGTSDSQGGFIDDVRLTGPPAPVPEPSTLLLLGSGLAGLVGYGRKRLKK